MRFGELKFSETLFQENYLKTGELMKNTTVTQIDNNNYENTYTKKDCIVRCRSLNPEQAYTVLAHFYGAGFARWFITHMTSGVSNECAA